MAESDSLIEKLAEQEAQRQRAATLSDQIQVRRNQIIKAQLPQFFHEVRVLAEAKAKQYQDHVESEQGSVKFKFSDQGPAGFRVD